MDNDNDNDNDDNNNDDKIMKDVDVHDRHSSIPVTHHCPAPTMSKGTCAMD